MKKAVLVLAVALLAVAMLVSPVMAIGPFGALGKNPKFTLDPFGGLVNWRKDDGGYITWSSSDEGDFWMIWQWYSASDGKGKAKNAISFEFPATLIQFDGDEEAYADGLPTVNENQWIFVDPDVKMTHPKYGEHGMVWWFYYLISRFNKNVADTTEARYPDGAFWQYNFIG